ncbi:hypothetical protein HG536_0H02550 [Torulaspora globosa]|uniref:PX domain-containing protein n=1 Tax=Torulaspora globosa TaxID=48254 RepID=A0A7G3ZMZ4_9SACH|nr:uncharacterized protein HG536_0H02550 [Torulaspora globosa]QLL34880.1 hypothetical protein HG536_0H02550 [Torulaspora globosa]
MDYEEDLNAPVWDELGAKDEPAIAELGERFNSLSNKDQIQDTNNELPEAAKTVAEGAQAWNSTNQEKKENLLKKLAPEEDPLLDIQTTVKESNIDSPVKAKEEPLFSGSTYIAFPELSDVSAQGDETNEAPSSGSHRSSTKPQVLFNSARIRRRPLSSHALDRNATTEAKISDPLGEIKKQEEFVDESLEEQQVPESAGSAKGTSILQQVNEPLFKLSPRKPSGVKDNEETLESDVSGVTKKDEEESKLIEFNIEVKDPVKVGELTSMHVEYTVESRSEVFEGSYAKVIRRYSDFRWLYRQLQNNHWGSIIPPPPEKQTVGRFKQDFIENRRCQMERMLRRIAGKASLQSDPDFLLFLKSEQFASDAKKREHITGSGASNDSNDLSEIYISEIQLLGAEDAATVLKNGGLDAESQKRFMNISFSSPPKYVEVDDFFVEQRQNIDLLEEKLSQLDKSLVSVDCQRNELASVTEEFARTIDSLATLEVTKKSSDLLTNFAQTHRRIKESLERTSLQEALTLGITLDEYLRLLSSLKAVFNQRAKLGQYLAIVEGDMTRKQSSLERLQKNSGQSSLDKLSTNKNEYLVLKRRFEIIKKSWQDVGNRIKVEISSFDAEKVKDFRNSMEIFLESAIEGQKEAIELWETFYQNNL